MNNRLINRLIAVVSTILCTALGVAIAHLLRSGLLAVLAGEHFGIPYVLVVGGVTGALVGLPFGQFITTHRRRWLVVAVLNVEIIASGIAGGWWALIYTATAAALTFCVSAFILRDLYESSEWAALAHHFKLAFGLTRGFQIIDEGKTIIPASKSPPLGPMLVIVRAGSAIVRQCGSTISGISGPSLFESAPFEYVAHSYDLQEKQATLVIQDVLTRDMVPATVELMAAYALDIDQDKRVGKNRLKDHEQNLLRALPYKMPNWDDATKAAVERAAREVISREQLARLLSPADFRNVGSRIRGIADNDAQDWGVRISSLIVKSLQPKPAVTAATERRWVADADAETTLIREQGRAEAMRNTMQTIATGYNAAKAAGMGPKEIQREVLRQILDQFARDPIGKLQLTPELNEFIKSVTT